MLTPSRSLLIVGVDEETAARFGAVLARNSIFAETLADAEEALELSRQLPFDILVLGYPLPGVDVQRYLASLRHASSPSRGAAVLLLATEGSEHPAAAYVGMGANRVVGAGEPPEVLQGAIAELLGVSQRFLLRAAMRIEVKQERGTSRSLCQTENVSASGMLVRTPLELAEGTELRFELNLPRESAPIAGLAVVVRRSDELRERVRGVGVQITSFHGKDGERFAAFITALGESQHA